MVSLLIHSKNARPVGDKRVSCSKENFQEHTRAEAKLQHKINVGYYNIGSSRSIQRWK